jgi:pyruvate dehydrogenase E2 component (dihydrolipoamide acetyltransferase)
VPLAKVAEAIKKYGIERRQDQPAVRLTHATHGDKTHGIGQVKVPDIGDFKDVAVIELLVKPGDTVTAEQSLMTVESDKASMEIPSSHAGVVKEIKVAIGDKVNEGSCWCCWKRQVPQRRLRCGRAPAAPAPAGRWRQRPPPRLRQPPPAAIEVRVPDIGDFNEVAVIEVMVKPGDTIKVEQSLITVESDKASMEIPSSHAGVVKEVKVALGDKVAMGSLVVVIEGVVALPHRAAAAAAAPAPAAAAAAPVAAAPAPAAAAPAPAAVPAHEPTAAKAGLPHASPSIRKPGARTGRAAGRGGRQRPQGPHHAGRRAGLRQARDGRRVQTGAQKAKAPPPAAAGSGEAFPGLLPWPKVDFAKFGPIERKDLSRIKKISGANLHRNWVVIPHVTNHDDADITELEAFRVQLNKEQREERHQGHDAGLHDQGGGGGAEEVPASSTPAWTASSWC